MTKMNCFGGTWTEEKLKRLDKYLSAYLTALKRKSFTKIYIDAFAGTGYREVASSQSNDGGLIEDQEADIRGYREGSTRIALKKAMFDRYFFIENDPVKSAILEQMLKIEFPDCNAKVLTDDANTKLVQFASHLRKDENIRAVIFVDPFGLSVDWQTVKELADTPGVDLWLLLPIGSGIQRLLKKNGDMPTAWRLKLNRVFGNEQWYDEFYETEVVENLLGEPVSMVTKTGTHLRIVEYYLKRLKEIFPGVAPNPLELRNTKGNPIFVLFFAASNKGKGAELAVKMAEHILKE
jgi:three-Cys-motif partner protein